MRHRDTVDAIVGAVTGRLRAPEVLVVGRLVLEVAADAAPQPAATGTRLD
ncbi:hypothetical protein ACGFIF_17230 [Kribbella sp. NPDC049174]